MTHQIIKAWEPARVIPTNIGLVEIHYDENLVARLSGTGFNAEDTSYEVELIFKKELAFRGAKNGSVMDDHEWKIEVGALECIVRIVENSKYVDWMMKQNITGFLDDRYKNAKHYVIDGSNGRMLEVISDLEPEIRVIKNERN